MDETPSADGGMPPDPTVLQMVLDTLTRLGYPTKDTEEDSCCPDMTEFVMPTPLDLDGIGSEGGRAVRAVGDRTFDIPYLPDVPWFHFPHDGFDFAPDIDSYLQLRGYDTWNYDPADLERRMYEGFIASSTFGLLEAVTALRIPEALLVIPSTSDANSKMVVSGERMVRLMRIWRDYMQDYTWPDEESRLSRGREVAGILERVSQFRTVTSSNIASIVSWEIRNTGSAGNVIACVAFVVFALSGVSYAIWQDIPEMSELALDLADLVPGHIYQELCSRLMLESGWCRYTISMNTPLMQNVPYIQSLLCRLRPYIPLYASEKAHRACTGSACVFYTIPDPDEYVPRHDSPSCTCAYVKPPRDEVRRILSAGSIPVIVLDTSGEVPALHVRPATDGPYIAISHVWADGMGSTTESGLPTCQVLRVAAHARGLLPGHGAFWIDSLCIPGDGSLRKSAIKLMARTYKEAVAVVVLDASVRATCSKALVDANTLQSTVEILTRIGLSGWMRRVWTLQEAVLAQHLYFEFADTLFDFSTAIGDSRRSISSASQGQGVASDTDRCASTHVLWHAVPKFYRDLDFGPSYLPIEMAIDLLGGRETTKREDEIIAISGLLPLDVSALLSITGPDAAEARVKECLVQLGRVPRALPMASGQKLTLPGFGWAPRSLTEIYDVSAESRDLEDDDEVACCREDGLRAWYRVLLLEKSIPIEDTEENQESLLWFDLVDAKTSKRVAVTLTLYPSTDVGRNKSTPAIDCLLFIPNEDAARYTVGCIAGHQSEGPVGEDVSVNLKCEYITHGVWDRRPHQGVDVPEVQYEEEKTLHVHLR